MSNEDYCDAFLDANTNPDELFEDFASIKTSWQSRAALPHCGIDPLNIICAACPFHLGGNAHHMGVADARRGALRDVVPSVGGQACLGEGGHMRLPEFSTVSPGEDVVAV